MRSHLQMSPEVPIQLLSSGDQYQSQHSNLSMIKCILSNSENISKGRDIRILMGLSSGAGCLVKGHLTLLSWRLLTTLSSAS